MERAYPIRSDSHQLEELSVRFFQNSLPKNWASEKPSPDYGVDLRIDLFEGSRATGLELLVQLKASDMPTGGETETVQLRTSTYNYLWDKLQVVMLLKYVHSEKEAFWLLFRDIPTPPLDQNTFTVHIPRANRVSNIEWPKIQDYVREVTDKKLASNRRHQITTSKAGA